MGKETNRELLRVGTPLPLNQLRKLLEALDDAPADATVSHYNGCLRIEAPSAMLFVNKD